MDFCCTFAGDLTYIISGKINLIDFHFEQDIRNKPLWWPCGNCRLHHSPSVYVEITPTGAFSFIAILIIMISNKNFSSEVPAGLQDVIYEGAFGGAHIRMQMVDGEPWFVAKDVANALDIAWNGKTLKPIPEEWQGMRNFHISGPEGGVSDIRRFIIINEAALYKLVFCSRKPEADRFVNWVTGTLLPSLRKTGRYEIVTPKRRRLLPRDRDSIDPAFWTEIRKYVLPKDIRDVAARMNVTLRHAQKVLAGTVTSYPVMEQFVVIGASNRTNGIMRPEARHYEQLVFQFAEPDGKEG